MAAILNRLWVGNLPQAFEKSDISSEFERFGKIKDVWIAFNPPGYAFVEFETEDEAKRAMEAMNGIWSPRLSCELRIQLSKKSDSQIKKEAENQKAEPVVETVVTKNRIKVEGIQEAVGIIEINTAFEEYGRIVDISVAKDNTSASVEFEEDESAVKAAESTNNKEMFGGTIKVELESTSKEIKKLPSFKKIAKPSEASEGKNGSARLFVGNLKRLVEKQELKDSFQHCGSIVDTWVSHNPPGFAFVEFSTVEEAQSAVKAMNKAITSFSDGLRVDITEKRTQVTKQAKEARLFIGGIKDLVDKEKVRSAFEKFGEITDVWVALNPPGFAFVEFSSRESAEKAVDAMNSEMCFGGKISVSFSKKQRDSDGGGGRGAGRGGRGGSRGGGVYGRPAVRTHPYAGDFPPERQLPPMRLPRMRSSSVVVGDTSHPAPSQSYRGPLPGYQVPPPSYPGSQPAHSTPPAYYDYYHGSSAASYNSDRRHVDPATAAHHYPPPAAAAYQPNYAASYPPPATHPPVGYQGYASSSYPVPPDPYSYYEKSSYSSSRSSEYSSSHSSRSKYYPSY